MPGAPGAFSADLPGGLRWFVRAVPWLGEDFFPSVDAGQIKLHLRAPTATRIEETAALCDDVERSIHEQIPANEIESVIDNIGLPYSSLQLRVQHFGADRSGRRRHHDFPEREPPPHRPSTFTICA